MLRLVRVGSLSPGDEFWTTCTGRRGRVVGRDLDGVRVVWLVWCMTVETSTLHPDVKVRSDPQVVDQVRRRRLQQVLDDTLEELDGRRTTRVLDEVRRHADRVRASDEVTEQEFSDAMRVAEEAVRGC